jgi:chemotaxis protein CheX
MLHHGAMAKTVDANLLNPFLTATLECFQVMGDLLPERKRLFLKTSPIMHGDIAGVIGMTNGVTGSCVVSFPESLARRIVAKLMMDEPQNMTKEMILDGIGEVANMVGGGAKRKLAGSGLRFDISTPTVLYGKPIQLFNPPDTIAIAAEFSICPEWPETFLFELATRPVEKR